jgi:hypothetical protein
MRAATHRVCDWMRGEKMQKRAPFMHDAYIVDE